MSEMLGEMLLKAGCLTKEQLEQVLGAQSIYGGRLGTNLVEMGLLGEDELSDVLNQKLGVPCVDTAALDSIPEDVLSVIPLEMVQRYRVLPVALEGKRLTLAMADPSDFNALDEIGFVTGHIIVPRLCSELRLNICLERHYGIKRAIRFIPVAGGLRTRFIEAGAEGEADTFPHDAYPAAHGEAQVAALGKAVVAAHAAAHDGPVQAGVEDAAASSHGDAASGPEGGSGRRIRGSEPLHASGTGDGGRRRITMETLAEGLAAAPSESQVVSALLTYLAGEFDRAAFLRLKCDTAFGVQAVCAGDEVEGFANYAVSLDNAQKLKTVVQERHIYFGEFTAEEPLGEMIWAMGGFAPAPALVVPIAVGGQVAAVICVNDMKGRLGGGVFELQRVAGMVELSFEMLRIRKRIKAS